MAKGVTLSLDEQETIVLMSRATNECKVYTSDVRDRKRFEKLYGPNKSRTYYQQGKPVAEEYTLDRRLVSFRSKIPAAPKRTEEQKAELRERMQKRNEAKKASEDKAAM